MSRACLPFPGAAAWLLLWLLEGGREKRENDGEEDEEWQN